MCNVEILGYCIVNDNCPLECIQEHENKEIDSIVLCEVGKELI